MFHLFTLVSFLALYTSALSFGFLAFQFIEEAFPDLLNYGRSMMWGGGRNAIAGLIVAFPLYLFLMRLIWKETKGNAKNLESGVRKWFTYITLVVVAGIMLGDLIAVVSSVLGGELAVRFLLKAGTIFAIAGVIFGYYLHDLKRKAEDSFSPRAKACVLAVTVFVLIFIGYGIVLTGTPGQQRALQFDQRRTSDLQQIASAIQMYWEQQKKLPQGFEDLKQQQFTYIQSVQDPETQAPYEYKVLGEKTYELCAVFATDSSQYEAKTKAPTPFSAEQWNHAKGPVCFTREVQPLLR
ncbi:MAG: hypothetical protein A3J30_01935 [Candidatus Wildermuthbacteria bacterium RIFCSPLOWO2_02_FULL_47_9c]|uniref:DUF5671 domain-containing protein n=1 Tax=Candidatus Wildermuthbacteria bacterium RIFCSPLOWO2_02_FULL_47_9c TaxID=1802466 RepID=A0A1G2RV61_9BACT|nr:MAG: hypothetical protein A3J30_01935 [Candidatus Wildermuthbacteria bacterium RIFCSPLOWO2_02_FULL_47_9c]